MQLPDLKALGPLVDIRVAVGSPVEEALKKANTAIPAPVPAKGLIDTGTTGSVIQPSVVSQLGLQPIGIVNICTPSSANVACKQYIVRLIFPNNVFAEVPAIEAPMQGQQIECLIGRDVLSHAVLVYNGYMNQFTMSF
ncbi:MAG: retropepsin-like aspartic protease [Candidatus Eisenbacteria bacterium]